MIRNGTLNDHTMGKNSEHLRFNILQNKNLLAGVAWGKAENTSYYSGQGDFLITLQERSFNNRKTIQGVLIDFRPGKSVDYSYVKKSIVLQRLVKGGKTTWEAIQSNARENLFSYFPDKNVLAAIYKLLESSLRAGMTQNQLQKLAQNSGIPWESFYLGLVIFFELKLLDIKKNNEEIEFTLLPKPTTKISLENSPLYRQIEEEYNLLKETGSWRA